MSTQREFQWEVGEKLRAGRAVLQVAPTGLGKTRGAIEPFTSGNGGSVLDTRLIYALPLRSLIGDIQDAVNDLAAGRFSCARHYGEKAESMIFSERACVTTIDQYLAAFAGAPLSSFTDTTTRRRVGRVKVGHAVAGAVMTSYSVFDEAHLLDPRNGLQLLIAVLSQRQRWGLLSTVSTATLPDSVIEYLTHDDDGPQLALVKASTDDIAQRDDHRKVTLEVENGLEPLTSDSVVDLCISGLKENSKVILFANTVDRAMEYYEKLKSKLDSKVMLIHSRFAPADRREKEKQVQEWFGRDSTEQGCVLVTTQVAEAGLNISAPLVLTELCPADSKVQRGGRCARFVPSEGRVVVFKPEVEERERGGRKERAYWLPYPQAVIKRTEDALRGFAGILNWQREKDLVNAALGELYGKWVKGENVDEELDNKGQVQQRSGRLRPIDALGPFERAFRGGSANELQQWLRNPEGRSYSVHVAIAESEAKARSYILDKQRPETVSIPIGILSRRLRDGDAPRLHVWELDPHEANSERQEVLRPVSQVTPGQTYLLLNGEAGYSADVGLTLRGEGKALGWRNLPRGESRQGGDEDGRNQTFQEHASGAFNQASRILESYRPFLEAWAKAVFGEDVPLDDTAGALEDAMKVAAMFHDVGKLQKKWQDIAREAVKDADVKSPIARFPYTGVRPPPHAAYAYPFLRTLFREANPGAEFMRHLEFIALAAARHHSLRVDGVIKPGGFVPFDSNRALAALKEVADGSALDIDSVWIEAAFNRIAAASAWKDEPYYADEAPSPTIDSYPLYCIAQRLVKLADWEDAGGRNIELSQREVEE